MKYIVILKDGHIFETEEASHSKTMGFGFLHIQLSQTNPLEIYQRFGNPDMLDPIKVVRFIDQVQIVTEADGSQHIETTWEQDPKVRLYHGYTTIQSIDRALQNDGTWLLTLISTTPDPEIVLEIYHDDEPTAETGGAADDESTTE